MNSMFDLNLIKGVWEDLGHFDIVKVIGSPTRLRAILAGDNGFSEVVFDNFHGYRLYNESDLIWYWKQFGGPPKNGVHRADGSEHLQWAALYSVSPAVSKLTNYIVVADDVLDVLSWGPPTFNLIDSVDA